MEQFKIIILAVVLTVVPGLLIAGGLWYWYCQRARIRNRRSIQGGQAGSGQQSIQLGTLQTEPAQQAEQGPIQEASWYEGESPGGAGSSGRQSLRQEGNREEDEAGNRGEGSWMSQSSLQQSILQERGSQGGDGNLEHGQTSDHDESHDQVQESPWVRGHGRNESSSSRQNAGQHEEGRWLKGNGSNRESYLSGQDVSESPEKTVNRAPISEHEDESPKAQHGLEGHQEEAFSHINDANEDQGLRQRDFESGEASDGGWA